MTITAYSYLRFSSAAQSWGDSRRRQTAMAERHAEAQGLVLDRDLTFRDLGISAFRNRNAREGALRAFLDAVELGIIPQGSHLLVESLDRISRDEILSAQALFLQIINAGIVLVTLIDGRSYSRDSLNANPCDLIISLVSMMRANEESATKSRRNRAAWEAKRARAAERPMTARCPGWLQLDKRTGRFEVLEPQAEVVRRVHRDTLAGIGQQSIACALNREHVPLFGERKRPGRYWHRAFISHLQTTPAVIGTLVPRVTEYVDGKLRLRVQAPVPGYYPAVIGQAAFARVQEVLAARRKAPGLSGPAKPVANIFGHLARCPLCDGPMTYASGGEPNWRYLICSRARAQAGCKQKSIPYPELERAVVEGVVAVVAGCPRPTGTPDARRQRLRWIARRLRWLDESRAEIASTVEDLRNMRAAHRSRVAGIETEIASLKAERGGLRARPPRWPNLGLEARLEDLRQAAASPELDRQRLNAALRAVLARVRIDCGRTRIILCWRHGGTSEVVYVRRKRIRPGPRRRGEGHDPQGASTQPG